MKKSDNKGLSGWPVMSLWVAAAMIGAVSCGAGNDSQVPDIEVRESVERPDKDLSVAMKAIAEGDAPAVAAICEYPIERPYPLRNITDSAAMVRYFPLMADSGLRNAIKKGSLNDWTDGGWRGWLFGDTALLSYENGIYAVGYVSESEHALRGILSREEIESLAPELRGKWQPVRCMLDTVDGTIFRIDRDESALSGVSPWENPAEGRNGKLVVYRLAYYNSQASLYGHPTELLTGSVEEDGSMGVPVFTFVNAKGDSCIYIEGDSGGDPNLTIKSPSHEKNIYAVPVYWRDYVSRPRK